MIINNFDIQGAFIRPPKAYAPLLIDPDAPLARPIALQGFQSVSRWRSHILQPDGLIQHVEFTQHHILERPPFRCAAITIKQTLRLPIRNAPDHFSFL
jgi:hypothetical protein